MSEVEQEEQSSQGVVLPVEWHVPDSIHNQYVDNLIVQHRIRVDKTAAVAEPDSIVQAYIRAYHAVVPKRTIEEEEAEEREWHDIISQPHVQQGFLRLAEGIRRQIAAGEIEEGGFAIE